MDTEIGELNPVPESSHPMSMKIDIGLADDGDDSGHRSDAQVC